MWNADESFDYPGDFDVPEEKTQIEKAVTNISNAVTVNVEPKNVVNIHVHLGRDVVNTTVTPSDGRSIDLMNILKDTVMGEKASEINDSYDEGVGINTIGVTEGSVSISSTKSNLEKSAEGTDVILIILVVIGCVLICIIIFALYLRYRNRPHLGTDGKRRGSGGGKERRSRVLDIFKIGVTEDSAEAGGKVEESGYLTPIRMPVGGIHTSTRRESMEEMVDIKAQTGSSKVRTGLENANYAGGSSESVRFDCYEEIDCEPEKGEKEKEEEVILKRIVQHQSSVTFGIRRAESKECHSYENSDAAVLNQVGGEEVNRDKISESFCEQWNGEQVVLVGADGKTGIDTANYDSVDEGLNDNLNDGDKNESGNPENTVDSGDAEIGWNDTIIPDRFERNVRDAIAQVGADRYEGDERLEKVLETLEEGMRGEMEEGKRILTRINQLYEDTPRRSKRIAEEVLKAKVKK